MNPNKTVTATECVKNAEKNKSWRKLNKFVYIPEKAALNRIRNRPKVRQFYQEYQRENCTLKISNVLQSTNKTAQCRQFQELHRTKRTAEVQHNIPNNKTHNIENCTREISSIFYTTPRDTCRGCFKTSCILTDRVANEEDQTIALHLDKMRYCFPDITFAQSETYELCDECCEALQNTYYFKNQIKTSETSLYQSSAQFNSQRFINICDNNRNIVHNYEKLPHPIKVSKEPYEETVGSEKTSTSTSEYDLQMKKEVCGSTSNIGQQRIIEYIHKAAVHAPIKCKNSLSPSTSFLPQKTVATNCKLNIKPLQKLTHNTKNGLNEISNQLHKCKFCTKAFNTLMQKHLHELQHFDSLPYNLPPKSQEAPKAKPFACKYCTKSFGHAATLTNHERFHTGQW